MANRKEEQLFSDIRKNGVRELRKKLIKSVVFYMLSITCLFWLENQNELFTRKVNPVAFWCIFVFILLIPIAHFQFYKLILQGSYYGEVTEIKNKRVLAAKNGDNESATAMYGDITMMGKIDVCVVTVRSRHGIHHEYVFFRDEMANFARETYHVGEAVFHPLFAKYPYNESHEPSRPFCLFCGEIGDLDSQRCLKCGGELWKKIDI